MTDQNFNARQRDAIKRMREMNSRSAYKEPPQPEPEKPPQSSPKAETKTSLFGGLNLPFLDSLKTDSDLTLILGILLLLLSEKADKRLLFALVYILL